VIPPSRRILQSRWVMRHDLGGICMSPDRALSIQERSVAKYDGFET
jgi:hypothetical protein